MQIKKYPAAFCKTKTGGKESLQKTAPHETQGTTPSDERGNRREVVYFEGVGWVEPADFYLLTRQSRANRKKKVA